MDHNRWYTTIMYTSFKKSNNVLDVLLEKSLNKLKLIKVDLKFKILNIKSQ